MIGCVVSVAQADGPTCATAAAATAAAAAAQRGDYVAGDGEGVVLVLGQVVGDAWSGGGLVGLVGWVGGWLLLETYQHQQHESKQPGHQQQYKIIATPPT
jgi:hypothetical protein